ncbi:MAG: mandelate racemase/muconate lactonizing enzyme family protein [Chloroflexota bacterium]|nr:mandelate racemase/muconate lactonizing enzyme family protein [Chloroflexota bacterium]
MRIVALDTQLIKVNHRGNWLHVILTDDEGHAGYGEASHGGFGPNRDEIVTAILMRQCWPVLEGAAPREVARLTTRLRELADGLAAATAVSACEQALWDLAGQAAGVPVATLFGGSTDREIPLYANINRAVKDRTPDGFAASARAAVAGGFRAIKLAPFDGIDQRRIRERKQRSRVHGGIACVATVRDAVGDDIDVMVDCHSAFDLGTAHQVARELAALGVTWFEEPLPVRDLDAHRELKPVVNELGMELVGGELLFGIDGYWRYLAAGIWDVIMPDVKHCGGLAALRTIGQVAAEQGIGLAPHNPSGPVATIASGHALAALPEHRPLEVAWGEVPWRSDVLDPPEAISAAILRLADAPGLGISRLAAAAGHHPVQ